MKKFIVGVMGPGRTATPETVALAKETGRLIGLENWAVLTGGRNEGVMDAACQGAKESGGLTIGIIPNKDPGYVSSAVDIPVYTDVGLARNNINVLSSDIVIAISSGTSLGTSSEVALALNHDKDVIFLNPGQKCFDFFSELKPDRVFLAKSPLDTIEIIKQRQDNQSFLRGATHPQN